MALADAAREAASRARSSLGGHGANVSGAVALASKERASLGDTHVTSVSGLSDPRASGDEDIWLPPGSQDGRRDHGRPSLAGGGG